MSFVTTLPLQVYFLVSSFGTVNYVLIMQPSSGYAVNDIHAVLLNTILGRIEWIINNGYLIIYIRPVPISDFNIEEEEIVDNNVD